MSEEYTIFVGERLLKERQIDYQMDHCIVPMNEDFHNPSNYIELKVDSANEFRCILELRFDHLEIEEGHCKEDDLSNLSTKVIHVLH